MIKIRGFVVSAARNLIFEPIYGVADFIGLEDFSRDGNSGMDNIEEWLMENTFDANAYLTGSKLGEITLAVVGLYEMAQGLAMIAGGVFIEGGGVVISIASGGSLSIALPAITVTSWSMVAAGAGVMTMGVSSIGSSLGSAGGPIKTSNIDLDDLKEIDDLDRIYNPSPKHDPNSGWGSPDPIPDVKTGRELLDTAYSSPDTKQLYNIYEGKLVKFQPDTSAGWHSYAVNNPAKEVPTDVLRNMMNDGKITKAQYKKFIKNK